MIDTHTHVVAADRQRYPLNPRNLSGQWYLEAPHTAEELAACMDEAGVDQAVLVQAVGAYTYDNAYAADAAAAHPGRFAGACCIDAVANDAVETLRYWVSERGMRGVRLFALAREGTSWLSDPATFPLWEEATHLGIHVIVTIFASQLDELRGVLRRFPGTRVSLDHCAFPDAAAPDPLFELASEANLLCKVSSVVLESAGDEAEPFVRALVGRFGAERVMWGSDFCQTHDRSYAELVALAERSFSGISSSERERCFVTTPRSVWPGLR
ncbi:MAG: amidohydrolase family protein [Myxococcota bacterium]